MLESTWQALRIFYSEYNEQLAFLTGDPRYNEWHANATA